MVRTHHLLSGKPERRIRSICCVGAGYVGGPSGAVIANKIPDVEVTIVDLNVDRIRAWNSDHLPLYEPGLAELVKTARDGIPDARAPNLFFSTQVDKAIAAADLIFVSVNTPTKTRGLGAGRASDLGWLESATRRIAGAAKHDTIVVEKSTVPCRTAANMREILRANAQPGVNFEVLSNPEFLAEGTAIKNLLYPDRILIGCLQTDSGWAAARDLAGIYAAWVSPDRIVTMNLWSSELAKLAANAILAQRISSINALSAICEATGANINEVSYACGLDSRIGPRMLQASVGFGGSCFKKDVLNLVYISESLNLPEVAAYWESVVQVNEYQKNRFTKRIINCLHGTLSQKKIVVLGFAYKKDTGDTRESTAITVVNNLISENANVSIYDPKVTEEQIMRDLAEHNPDPEALRAAVTVHTDAYQACENAHAVVILTEWEMFSNKTPELTSSAFSKPHPGFGIAPLSIPMILRPEGTRDVLLPPPPPANQQNYYFSSSLVPKIDTSRFNLPPSPTDSDLSDVRSFTGSGASAAWTQPSTPLVVNDKLPQRLDWSRIAAHMQRPMYVFDGRNILDAEKLEGLGMRVEAIGVASSWLNAGLVA